MSGPKDDSKNSSPNSKVQKNGEINPDEWTFDVRVSKNANGELEEVRKPVKRSVVTEAREERERKQREKLTLEEAPKQMLTRRQMADKMQKEEKTGDVFSFAHPIKRILAMILDLIIVAGATYIGRFFISPFYHLHLMALERYNYKLDITKVEYFHYGQFVVFGFVYFFFMVIGTAFYNRTPGKKFLGITVRNDQKFSLNVTDMFVREFILKPISIASVVGILMALFHKKRKTLHDLLIKTLVIED